MKPYLSSDSWLTCFFFGNVGDSYYTALRILGMSWGVKTACFKAPGVWLGGSGVFIGGVRILRVVGKKQGPQMVV